MGPRTTIVMLFICLMSVHSPQSVENRATDKLPTSCACPVTLPRKAPAAAARMFGSGAAAWNGNLFVGGLWPEWAALALFLSSEFFPRLCRYLAR